MFRQFEAMIVDFYYSIGSRYSYLASTIIATLEKETGYCVVWHPVNSVKLIDQRGANPFKGEPTSGQYEWSYRELDAKRWAALYGVPYVEPRRRVRFDSELLARACTAAKCFVDPLPRLQVVGFRTQAGIAGTARLTSPNPMVEIPTILIFTLALSSLSFSA